MRGKQMTSGFIRAPENMSDIVPVWMLYILRCADGSYYTGISTDVQRRLREHSGEAGRNKGAKALRGKGPLQLAFQIQLANKSEALKLEYRIKQLSKTGKESLVRGKLDPRSLIES